MVLGLAVLSCPSVGAAQPVPGRPLADSTVWERLGTTKQQAGTFAFSGSSLDPTIWVGYGGDLYRKESGQGLWQEVRGANGDAILFLGPTHPAPDTILTSAWIRRSTNGGATSPTVTYADTGLPVHDGGPGLAEAPLGSPIAGRIAAVLGNSVAYSTDRGATWHKARTWPDMYVADLVALRSGRVITAGFLGAALSDDGGDTFRPIPDLYAPPSVRYYDHQAIEVLPGFTPRAADGGSTEGRLMVVGGDSGDGQAGFVVYVSDDEGDSWRRPALIPTTTGLIGGLVAVPEVVGGAPGWAMLALSNGLVWVTVDGGETWAEIGVVPQSGPYPLPGSPWNSVTALAVGPDGRLYAGITRQGPEPWWSWRTKDRVADVIRRAVASEASPESEAPLSLGVSVRPNPAGGRAEIVLSLAEAQAVRVSIFDVQGREVAVLLDGSAAVGEQRLGVDTSSWPAGVYVVRASVGAQSVSARLVVAR